MREVKQTNQFKRDLKRLSKGRYSKLLTVPDGFLVGFLCLGIVTEGVSGRLGDCIPQTPAFPTVWFHIIFKDHF